MRGVSDHKIFSRSRVVCMPQVIKAVRFCPKIKKNHSSEMDIAPRTMSRIIKRDLGLLNNKQDNTLL
jgi:hypothetical protein